MASKGFLDTCINALPENIRYPLQKAFYHLSDTWKVGTDQRAVNAQWYRYTSTTATVAGTEFSIAHNLGAAPSQLFQVLDLSLVNSQMVPLQVSKASDAERIYLKSTSTNAVFVILAEV